MMTSHLVIPGKSQHCVLCSSCEKMLIPKDKCLGSRTWANGVCEAEIPFPLIPEGQTTVLRCFMSTK